MVNKIVKNRPSPKNEQAIVDAYQKQNPSSKKSDKLDVSAVETKNGEKGYAFMNESINRSHDKNYHIGKDYISEKELKKIIKNKR